MERLAHSGALDAALESTLRHDRRVIAASLLLVLAVAWLYLWRAAAAMSGMDMPDMPMPQGWGPGAFVLTLAMWLVMMVGMMLPGAAPTILLYAAMVRKNGERGTVLPQAWIFTSGYLAVWAAFSVLATLLQVALDQAALLTPMLRSANQGVSAAILVAAGIYQWLPVKQVCLRNCRSPLQWFVARWRPGAAGAFRMGAENGYYCLGCCWLLMLLLFVAGVMNLLWVALISAFVFAEKLLPAGRFTARFAGLALIFSGAAVLLA